MTYSVPVDAGELATPWTIPIALSCRGLDRTRLLCEEFAGRLAFARHRGDLVETLAALGNHQRTGDRRHRSPLLKQVEPAVRKPTANGIDFAEYGFALMNDGRWAEALAAFLHGVELAPTHATPAEGALFAFGLLWPSLDDTQRHDGAMQLAGVLGHRLETMLARGRDFILIAQLYNLAGEPARALQFLQSALATRPSDPDLQSAIVSLSKK